MNTRLLVFGGLCLVNAPAVRGIDFIRQIQLIHGQSIVYDIPISGETGQIASKPLEGDGAIFQLYAYADEIFSPYTIADLNVGTLAHANISLSSHLLDLDLLGIHLDINLGGDGGDGSLPSLLAEKTVGTYYPDASVVLTSEDPYPTPRTRADRPYGFRFSVRKLAEAPATPGPFAGPTKVRVERSYKLYEPTLHVPAPNGTGQGRYSDAYEFQRNGDYSAAVVYQTLPGDRPTKAIGEETFSAYVQVNSAGQEARIAASTIQVWPVCGAEIQGIEAGKRYQGVPETAKVVMTDLYPDSVTYAQIYKGEAGPGHSGHVIPSSVVSFNTYAPQNAVVPLSAITDGIDGDGTYTIEVATITPFNQRKPERISWVTFIIDRTLEVNGLVGTKE